MTETQTLNPARTREQAIVEPIGAASGVHALAIFLSAFLLFQVELIMGKFLLPRFGGGASVWSTALLIFQVLLLAGYGYAALICAKLSPRLQKITHVSLLAGSGLVIVLLARSWPSPILPGHWKSGDTAHPVWHIALLLVTAVGFQCILLSATSPLQQSWLSRLHGASPYRLYALSNLGSMLGLLTYPLLVERLLTLSMQAWVWTIGYGAFLTLAGIGALLAPRPPQVAPAGALKSKPAKAKMTPAHQPRLLWLALAGCATTMLLATTNLVCQQMSAIPLLWVLPLSLYLLSFIICFDHARWYRRDVLLPLYFLLALLSLKVLPSYAKIHIVWLVGVFGTTLLAVCMVCHGELARLKPDPKHLTSFYLMVGSGGALGSAAVVLLAPNIFDRYWEFQIALLGCGGLVLITLLRDHDSWFYRLRFGRLILPVFALLLLAGAYSSTDRLLDWEGRGDNVIARTRNFFGVKRVLRKEDQIILAHGYTLHGIQNTDPDSANEPTSYYVRQSGIGLLLEGYPRPAGRTQLRVGVVGMGAGTLAAYGQPGDYYRFYEIDPAVADLSRGAHPIFTFVQSSAAHVDVAIGDGRILMQEEVARGESQNFDVLVIDAFSGDAIPVHLLTREAIQLYLRELRGPDSVIAFHLSNSSLDLQPLIATLAAGLNLNSEEINTPVATAPVWVLLSRNSGILRMPVLAGPAHPIQVTRAIKPWTDDYSNLYQLLRW